MVLSVILITIAINQMNSNYWGILVTAKPLMTKAIVVILNAKDTPLIGNLDTIEAVLRPHMLYSMDKVKHDTWQATILCWRFKYQAKQFQLYFVVP